MEDLDPLAELERMAANASASNLTNTTPSHKDIKRWVTLFKYNYLEAEHLIIAHRSDITRTPISDEHWSLVALELERLGYDREAYEHSLTLKDLMKTHSSTVYDVEGNKWTVFRLGGLLESAEKVREIAGLEKTPKVTQGEGDTGVHEFVWVDENAMGKVESWLESKQSLKDK
jgi:hypothetical protein